MKRLTYWNGKKWILPQGSWREIADRLAAYENTGLEPDEIAQLQAHSPVENAVSVGDGIFTAVIVAREGGGYVPYIDPVSCCAFLRASEIRELADNPDVINQRGANHLVIEAYPDRWHVAQVGGYTSDGGMYTKLY